MALRVLVCKLSDVGDGQLRAFQVRGVTWPVIVTRIDGELIACPGVCPHDDVALWEGDLVGATITCPGHGYQFDLQTGRCRHEPLLELRRYPVTVLDDEIWVDLL
jgi:nitrite reductase/ring-hydroxylating ferredoxin subunit